MPCFLLFYCCRSCNICCCRWCLLNFCAIDIAVSPLWHLNSTFARAFSTRYFTTCNWPCSQALYKEIKERVKCKIQTLSALNVASIKGHEMCVKRLLQNPSINVNIANRTDGMTALMSAAMFGHEGVVRMLLNHPNIKIKLSHPILFRLLLPSPFKSFTVTEMRTTFLCRWFRALNNCKACSTRCALCSLVPFLCLIFF